MLPIDIPSEAARALLTLNGEDPDALLAAVCLDGGRKNGEDELLLAISENREWLYRLDVPAGELTKKPLCDYTQPYVDSALSTCRLLAVYTPQDGEPYTVSIGVGSHACRSRLFIFLAVWEAVTRGERLTGEEAMFEPLRKQERAHSQENRGAIRRMLPRFVPSKWIYLPVLLTLVVEIGADFLSPYLSGKILFDNIIVPTGKWHSMTSLLLCVGAVILVAVLRWLSINLRRRLFANVMVGVTERIRDDLFVSIQRQSMAYFNRTNYGRLAQTLESDVAAVQEFFSGKLISLFIYLAEFGGVAVLLFLLNWKLSLFILIPIPLIILIYRRAFPVLTRLNIRSARVGSALTSRINDSLTGFRVVKAFAREEDETKRLDDHLQRMYRVNLQANLVSALLGPAVALLIYLANQAIWGIGGFYVMGGELTYGDFCTYLGYVGMVFAPLQFFSSFAMIVGRSAESAGRIMRTLDAVPDVLESSGALAPSEVRGEIDFSGVRFHYVPSRPILRGVSFHIAAGEHIGLVGQTGCGKSTIANLLLRMYDVTGGRIRLDGVDVRDLTVDTLRRSIAIVSQEVHIFRGSIADNIRFARPEATDEEVVAAARAAGAHDFIMALSDGYNTPVGVGGRALSGGECQRVSIARAIITQPRILILDEATAAMDNETEQRIANALATLTHGRTTISIAHRLSTLRDCDRIMAMDGGRIVESGTREELIAQGGIFCKLYTLQNEQLEQVLKGVTEDESN